MLVPGGGPSGADLLRQFAALAATTGIGSVAGAPAEAEAAASAESKAAASAAPATGEIPPVIVSVPGPEVAPKTAPVENVNPADIRFSQNTAGGKGRADVLRQSMGEKGWAGDPVDAVRTPDGITTIDNTRVAVARELGIKEIPVRVHAPNEPLPPDMIGRFGDAKTWGEALAQRTGNQKPPLPPPGTPDASRMPKPKE